MDNIKNLLSFITNLIFPHSCIICGDFTNYKYYTGLCLNCYKKLQTFNIKRHPELIDIIENSHFDDFNAVFLYDENLAKAILDFKFNDKPQFAQSFANLMANKLDLNADLIIPVPVHFKRLCTRKYNQASLITKYLSRKSKIKYSNKALKRIVNTPHQTGQAAKLRKKQLENAFLANEKLVNGKDIILIDDVFTTGSTVNLCAEELKAKGAKSIKVITIAYTPLF